MVILNGFWAGFGVATIIAIILVLIKELISRIKFNKMIAHVMADTIMRMNENEENLDARDYED